VERQEGDGEESSVVDDDEDKKNPQGWSQWYLFNYLNETFPTFNQGSIFEHYAVKMFRSFYASFLGEGGGAVGGWKRFF
jgi:hypothetical protein